METYTVVFKQVTERLLPVRVEAEDYDHAMELGLAMIREATPETLARRTRLPWSPAVTTLEIDRIE